MKAKNIITKPLTLLQLAAAFLCLTALSGCPSDAAPKEPQIKVAIKLNDAATIGEYFEKIYISAGNPNYSDYPNILDTQKYIIIEKNDPITQSSASGAAEAKYFQPPEVWKWTPGETLTLILCPKETSSSQDYLYGYKNSNHDNKYVSIQQGTTTDNLKNTMTNKIRVWSVNGGRKSEVNLNYKEFFVIQFPAKDTVIDLSHALPDAIQGSEIRLQDENGYFYMDTTLLSGENHISTLDYRKVTGINTDTSLSEACYLPKNKLSFCPKNLQIKFKVRITDDWKTGSSSNPTTITAKNKDDQDVNGITQSDSPDSSDYGITFNAPATAGEIYKFRVNNLEEITDTIADHTYTGTYTGNNGDSPAEVSLVMNQNKSFNLTWGSDTIVGTYTLNMVSGQTAATLTASTKKINIAGEEVCPKWNLLALGSGWHFSNSNIGPRWPGDGSHSDSVQLSLQQP
ncbi:MAG: hypothetical protein K5930_12530 [Treponemataceae bacterium]|nr:hypothetical protein [Treponemataceae bacterium]